MPDIPRNAPCPCGSGKKYKHCHGSDHPPSAAAPAPGVPPGEQPLDNPFRRIFKADGTVNQEYVRSRLAHLDDLVRTNRSFFPLRFDRDDMEEILAESQDLFAAAEDQDGFEEAFRKFAALALPKIVTKEFDERAKEVLRTAIHDSDLTRRDRAAAACGLILTLPEEGPPPQPHHENPLLDLVLRVTFNESMARVEFLRELSEQDPSPEEREARLQEFFRATPALMFEIEEGFRRMVRKAVTSYEKGEYSFGIGMDMVLRGVRAVRRLTQEYEEQEGDAFTDRQRREFNDRFGQAITDAFAEDIGEEEEGEIFDRMSGFLEDARRNRAKKAVKGLSSALEIMERNPEIRHRLLLAAYHEAVTGSRIYREAAEEEPARAIFAEPFDLERYQDYGECLEDSGNTLRAERVYRAALELFPEDEEVRVRLDRLGRDLEPGRVEAAKRTLQEARTRDGEEE